ncbi:cation:proton antiporter regulatory subunit [Sphaerisporangium sp. TRM90804]|uniref:cation:proton antiporter regulatory subunit n=1 Tax=Sphaerisporangium sp. TRM90804 TaxID=3031113 RepID=UPI00244C2BF0|nr:cation:proton antiporter regulatory subunit [Sphaerisporangium sp. TRM90804]MDH2425881.1 cation:proton antiporter regulatory subunit [Sphaerisporangium sp. TRM90804]
MEIEQTALPGIGLKHEFTTHSGRRIAVVSHRTGRRDVVIYDRHDPDRACEAIQLNDEEADALVELLGAPRIVQRLNALHREVEGLVSVQIPIAPGSPYGERPMGQARVRTRTGASIVAIVRGGQVHASPTPDFPLAEGDVVVVVGSPESTAAVADILANG